MTLIEVMLALLIFSVGILAVAAMQITSIKCHRIARDASQDAFAVSEQLELLSVMPFHHDWLTDCDGSYRTVQPDHGPFHRYNEPATIAWEVGAALPVRNAKRIAAIARRSQPGINRRALIYESIKAESYETRLLLGSKNPTRR
jgi:hypothetical protein